jgi:multiple sugar transport system permease protein
MTIGSRRTRLLKRSFFYLLLILTCGILFFPFYWMINTSLAPRDSLFLYPPKLLHPDAQLGSYRDLFENRPIFKWMRNSAVIVLIVTTTSTCFAAFAGYSMSRFRRRGTAVVGGLLLASRMLPTTLLVIPLFITMQRLDLVDSLFSLVLADLIFIVPFAAWMLKTYFDSIPRELEEAAWLDGAGRLRGLFQIVMPLAAPGLAATGLYSSILAWDEFIFARTFINSEDKWTITLGLASFTGQYVTYWNDIMAASLIGCLPIVVLFLFVERYLVTGITAGSVKG